MARKRHRHGRFTGNTKPPFVFTQETITITQKALERLEQPLHRADHSNEKVAFAEETILRVKGKLGAMKQSIEALCLMLFDYNEKVIIRQAILLYSIYLLDKPPSAKYTKELHRCRQITAALTDTPTPAR